MAEGFNRTKAAYGVSGLALDQKELSLINQHTIRAFTAEELFAFKVTACDNEIDRDMEVFSTQTLSQLAELYVGKTVLSDPHYPLPENQCARIYAAQVIKEQGKTTSYGEPYAKLVLRCYMPRTEAAAEMIRLIEAGIRKEVSVGCSVHKSICSICGESYYSQECNHRRGEKYEKKLCFVILEDAADAYEVSFCAVPVQPAAGVSKSQKDGQASRISEFYEIMDAVKSLREELQGKPPDVQLPATSPAEQPSDPPDDIGELIRSAKALAQPYI